MRLGPEDDGRRHAGFQEEEEEGTAPEAHGDGRECVGEREKAWPLQKMEGLCARTLFFLFLASFFY